MALARGARLGVYEVTEQIGEGGMGQVYRATDTRLKRQVAIKILPPSLAPDHDRLARFQREAEVLASLNHPHIAGIYGLEETDGVSALVMELVDGEDLSQRIARGAIPIDEALAIAKQIADALEAAHEQGIIHRDLKPANIKVRPDGAVKVLDFGLAKAMAPTAGSSPNVSLSPTFTTPAMMTGVGMLLGTAAYMSPEQARGRVVDKRADVWAFGAVLFEIISGRRAFPGEDITDTIVSVVSKEPDWRALPASAPAGLRRLLTRCLKKDPKARLQAIGDARVQIEELLSGAPEDAEPIATAGVSARSTWSRALPWAVAGALATVLLMVVGLWAPWRAEKPADRPLVRLDVDLGADVSLPAPTAGGSSVAISPDGTRLVYASGTPSKLFIRRLDQPRATELPGTQGGRAPFFSPDGQWVGFWSPGRLNKMSAEGGAVVPLGPIANFAGASWSEDGTILVSVPYNGQGVMRFPAGGGPPETIEGLGGGTEVALPRPQLLPGGKAVLFSTNRGPDLDQWTIEVFTLADRHRKVVARGGTSARYLATSSGAGHLVYVVKATLFAAPFDLNTLEVRGPAVPVLDDVAYADGTWTGHFDISRVGTVVYRKAKGGSSELMTLQWVDHSGKKEPLRSTPGTYRDPALSPDGKRVALVVDEGGRQDVGVYDPQRDTLTKLTFGGHSYRFPAWSPDAQYVVFSSPDEGYFQARANGAGQPMALTPSKGPPASSSFAPDSKRLAYVDSSAGRSQIWTVPLEDRDGQLTAGKPEQYFKSTFETRQSRFSPDGRWLAYSSNESGPPEVFVRPFPPPSSGQGGKWQISNSGGQYPRWLGSGHELVYQSGDQIMAVSYTVSDNTFIAEKPRVWIAKLGGTQWDVAPDGKRVVVLTPVESTEAPTQDHEVVFLQNFFDELRRRVPLTK